MKKIFSLLLVALLLVGMLPATAIHSHAAGETATETLTIYANKSSASSSSSISWTQNGVTFTNLKDKSGTAIRTSDSDHYRVYQNSKVQISAPGKITKIVITSTSSTYNTPWINSAKAIGSASNSGNVITVVPTTPAESLSFSITAQVRLNKIAVTYEAAAAPSCEHTNTVTQNAKDASCTEEGYTGDMVCSDCGETVKTGSKIDMLSHNFVDGVCSACGLEKANIEKASAIAIGDQIIFVCESKNVELNGFNGTSYAYGTNYNGTPLGEYPWTVVAGASDGTFAFKNSEGKYLSWTSGNSAKTVASIDANASWTVSFDADGNAIVLNAKDTTRKLQWNASSPRFACYSTGQTAIQIYSFATESEGGEPENPETPACTHENTTTTTVDATCTVAGSVTVTCDSCGETISTQEIPVIDHTYVDGFCSCGKAEPVLTYTRYYIAAKRTGGGKVYYMTNALTTTSTKRYTAFATDLTEVPEKITNAEADKVFVLVDDGSGTYKIYAEGIEGENKYLGWTSGNSGALVSAANAKKVTVVYNQDGSVKISFVDGDGFRKLTLNNTSGNDYFAWYGTEQANIYLIPVSDVCVHENTTTTTVDATCTVAGSETVVCDDCGETVSTNVIDALGHSYNEDVTDPDCVNGGYTTYTCTACGHSYVGNNVDALGHSYDEVVTAPTAIKEGYTTFTCSVCNDSYVDHIVPAIGIGELKFEGAILELKNDLTMNFAVSKDLFIEDAYTAPYVVFNVGIKTQTVTTYTSYENYYVFACTNISPSQLGDTVTATLYATLNGETLSTSLEYSVAEYCYTTLETSDDALLKTLVVDLLNYGSASQTYVWYKDKTLSNAALTDEQKAYASADSELASVLKTDYATVENASAQWTGAGLVLKTNVCVRFRFVTDDVEGLSVKITAAGKEWIITEFEESGIAGQYYVSFTGLTARQMSEDIFATLCRDGVAVSNTVRYSVESYAYAKQNDADARLANLVKAMMRYGKSAAAYLN